MAGTGQRRRRTCGTHPAAPTLADLTPGWTRRDIARELGRSIGTVCNWGLLPHFPAPIGRRGTANLYDPAQVRSWCEQNRLTAGPDRWSLRQAAAELGMNFELLRSARQRGRLPKPDGRTGIQPWWRPATLRAWRRDYVRPDGAWDRRQVALFLGLSTPPALRLLPPVDGRSAHGAWWCPATIHTWQEQRLAARATAAEQAAQARFERSPDQLYGKDVAAATGLSWDSVRTYRRKGLLPEPDGWHGHRPWWSVATIERWNRRRRRRTNSSRSS